MLRKILVDKSSFSVSYNTERWTKPIIAATRAAAWTVFARSNTGIVGSNPTGGMDVRVCWFCVNVVLCVGGTLRKADPPSKESYRLCTGKLKKRPRSIKMAVGPNEEGKRASDKALKPRWFWVLSTIVSTLQNLLSNVKLSRCLIKH
jgi:hypothetical protein